MAENPVATTRGFRGKLVFWWALIFSVFQLTVPVFLPIHDLQLRAYHVLLGISTALIAFPFRKSGKPSILASLWDWLTVGIVLAANVNMVLVWEQVYRRPGDATIKDLVLGVLLSLVILEAARRTLGWAIPLFVGGAFAYVFLGPVMPGMWHHGTLSLEYVLASLYYSAEGIYGSITSMSATFIVIYILFGALLLHTGTGKTFMDLALLIAGRFRGGAAQVAVVSSAMFGMISGSAVANVSVTGNYTIPLMKRLGYPPNFAGAVESMASTGGLFTPPIMGIGAFLMAQFLEIPYITICYYAIIPCSLFYLAVACGIYFEARRLGLQPVPAGERPGARDVLRPSRMIPFLVPILALVFLLLRGYVLITAGFVGCMLITVLHVFSDLSLSGVKRRLHDIIRALVEGGRSMSRLVPILVAVGMLTNLIDISGVAPKFVSLITQTGGETVVGALLIGAIAPIILGAPLPASASYVICYALVVPALVKLGLNVVAVNMFVFYYCSLASVTPPTCNTCVVAAGISGGHWLRTSFTAMRLGYVALLMPFVFVLDPSLLGIGNPTTILFHYTTALVGAFFAAAGFAGYLWTRLKVPAGLLLVAGGMLLIIPSPTTDLIGVLLIAGAIASQWVLGRYRKRMATS